VIAVAGLWVKGKATVVSLTQSIIYLLTVNLYSIVFPMRKWLSCLISLLVSALVSADICPAQGLTVLQRSDKTELADPFSVVAAVGGEFGLPTLWWWHRINAGWGSVRREVAQLYVSDPAEGVVFSLQGGQRTWNPNHLHQQVEMDRLRFSEDKFVDRMPSRTRSKS